MNCSLILFSLVSVCCGETILMFSPWNTRSLRIQQNAILEGLLDRGHRVTGVFPQEYQSKHENYTEIVVNSRYNELFLYLSRTMTGFLDFPKYTVG